MKIHELSLATLKYFIDTVELESFTRAAEKNHVTRPAISQALLRLEIWAGVKLINHKKKTLELTKEGEAFYKRAKKSYDNFELQLNGEDTESLGLRIGCSASLAESFLLPGLKKLKNLTNIEIKVGTSAQLIQMLEEKIINVAIVIADSITTNLQTEVLRRGKFNLASKNGKLNNLIIVTEDRLEVVALKRWLVKKDKNHELIKVESWGLAGKMADAINAAFLVPDFMHGPRFKKIPTPGYEQPYTVILVQQPNQFLSGMEVELCRLLKQIKFA